MRTIESPEPHLEKFKVEEKLGQGQYGVVYLVTNKEKKEFAIKVIDTSQFYDDQREMDGLLREVNVLSRLRHPNIITYHWSWQTDSHMFIKTEYCYYRDLWILVKENGRPDEEQFRKWIHQISSGIQHLHENDFMHRNIKPTNVMVTEKRILKLGDFGTARKLPSAGMALTNYVGTPYFMSPEILKNMPYSQSTDIWSLGCTCYTVSILECLNEGKTFQQIVSFDILLEQTKKVQHIPYSNTIKSIISCMLMMTPSDRPTARDIIAWIETSQHYDQATPKSDKSVPPTCEKMKENLRVKISKVKDLSKTCPAEFFHGPFKSKFSSKTTVPGPSAASPIKQDDVNHASSTEIDYDIEFEIQKFLSENLGYEKFKAGLSCIQNPDSDNTQAEEDLIKAIGEKTFRRYEIFFRQLRAIFMQETNEYNDLGKV